MGFTDTGLAKHDYLRVCDICGHRFHISQMKPIGELRWACPDDAPGLTAMQISRWNARARPLTIKPNKWAKGFVQTPTYQLSEAATFNLIASVAPANVPNGASDQVAAAWAAIYMADLVTQNLRPPAWIATARAVLRTCVTYLLTQQTGSPTGPVSTVDNPRYGGFLAGGLYLTSTAITAGVAFVKAAAALGDTTLLLAADRVATFLRHQQCGDLQVSQWTVYPSGGAPYHVGGLASGTVDSSGLQVQPYSIANVSALWFLALLGAVRGLGTSYGDASATSFFSAATAAPLSRMISELTAFAVTGARDISAAGAFVSGLSPTKAQASYSPALHGGGGSASWTFAATISSDSIAQALLGLFVSGDTSPTVTTMLAWLAAFTPNSANAVPVQPESVTIAGIWGTYDPTLCVADNLQATAPFTEAAGAKYSWSSLGLLSPILGQPTQPSLRRSKDTLNQAQRFSATDIGTKYLGPAGLSGLSLQPAGVAPTVTLAAKGGMIWRQPPGHYPQVALF